MARSKRTAPAQSQLRIIGGSWRSRKITFPAIEGIRPTPDRVRETLFNWLAADIRGACCADLFAGSGALGLEALSRGARQCVFIDSAPAAIRSLSQQAEELGATERALFHAETSERYLLVAEETFDIVFIDPPYHQGLVAPTVSALDQRGLLAEQAWVYIETAVDEALPPLPDQWELHRDKQAGDVAYRLFLAGP